MKKFVLLSAAACAALAAAGVQAQEVGRVISSTPVIQQVAVPQQVCSNQPVAVQQQGSPGGAAFIGGLLGGVLGNTVGHGMGRAAATMAGVIGGAALGSGLDNRGNTTVQTAQNCTTQNTYENRTVAYNVTYEYAGRQHMVQMAQDPGPTVRLNVSAVGAQYQGEQYAQAPYGGGSVAVPSNMVQQIATAQPAVVYAPPVVYAPQVVYAPSPYYYGPSYYGPSYYAPLGVSLNFGYSGYSGGYYGGHRHRHWR